MSNMSINISGVLENFSYTGRSNEVIVCRPFNYPGNLILILVCQCVFKMLLMQVIRYKNNHPGHKDIKRIRLLIDVMDFVDYSITFAVTGLMIVKWW